jgi:hypothetical protein
VSSELTEDDSRAYGVVQAFSLFLAGGALYAATLLTYRGGEVFLGLVKDPYDRVVWLGVGMGIPDALCGAVIAVHNFGAGDIIEIAPPHGPTMLLPFTNAVVPTVDLAAGRVVIELPQEILGDDVQS